MSKRYQLLFRGAVRKDQHASVVRGRLQKMLKASDAQLEALFSGKPVSIKKNVDEATAERYVDAFFQAGAKLELVELDAMQLAAAAADAKKAAAGADSAPAESAASADTETPSANAETDNEADASTSETAQFQLAAPGTVLVDASERPAEPVSDVPTDHLSLAQPGTDLGGDSPSAADVVAAPVDTSHLSLDDPGATLGVPVPPPELTEALLEFDFVLGEVGEVLVESQPVAEPELPDLSHLQIEAIPEPAEELE